MAYVLDAASGIPIYRQIIEQVKVAISSGELKAGDQLPTVRQLAVDLSINLNTVIRAYRELELEGFLDMQQGTGTFVSTRKPEVDQLQKQRMIDQIVADMVARASSYGISMEELAAAMRSTQEISS
ncbi:MAG: GntR family transcriptional regulator [Pseudomonadales bacterium]|jgi:GntR family transcriptional regulator|nr:GntR family transcriptional regulator [Pseudomonadales bacterium]